MLRRVISVALIVAALSIVSVAVVSAHPHVVTQGNGNQTTLANGHDHPGFVFNAGTNQFESCEGVSEPADTGPAGYGLETAHHGPDQGTPGKADGCFALDTAPAVTDNNPAID